MARRDGMSAVTRRGMAADEDEPGAPAYGAHERLIVASARHMIAQHIQAQARHTDVLMLTAVTVTGLFCDLISTMRIHPDMLAVINRGIADAGLEVVPRRRPANVS